MSKKDRHPERLVVDTSDRRIQSLPVWPRNRDDENLVMIGHPGNGKVIGIVVPNVLDWSVPAEEEAGQ